MEMQLRRGYLIYKIVCQIFFQAKQECMHYHSGHQTIALCIYYSTFLEMAKLVSPSN